MLTGSCCLSVRNFRLISSEHITNVINNSCVTTVTRSSEGRAFAVIKKGRICTVDRVLGLQGASKFEHLLSRLWPGEKTK